MRQARPFTGSRAQQQRRPCQPPRTARCANAQPAAPADAPQPSRRAMLGAAAGLAPAIATAAQLLAAPAVRADNFAEQLVRKYMRPDDITPQQVRLVVVMQQRCSLPFGGSFASAWLPQPRPPCYFIKERKPLAAAAGSVTVLAAQLLTALLLRCSRCRRRSCSWMRAACCVRSRSLQPRLWTARHASRRARSGLDMPSGAFVVAWGGCQGGCLAHMPACLQGCW